MILLLDCGNSRLKWALAGPHGWMSQGNVPNQEIGTLALRDWQSLPRPSRVVGVNVAGEPTRVRVEAQLVRWRTPPEWLIAQEEGSTTATRGRRSSARIAGLRWSPRDSAWPTSCSRRRASWSTRAPR
jgi:type III pantothenate kinase